jgi:hypothetical protein
MIRVSQWRNDEGIREKGRISCDKKFYSGIALQEILFKFV